MPKNAQPRAQPKAEIFSLNTPYLSAGRITSLVAKTENLWIHTKVNAAGGENALHAHTDEDHAFVVLEGEVTFFDKDDNGTVLKPFEGIMIPKGAYYRYLNTGSGNLIVVRIGAATRIGLLSDVTLFQRDAAGHVTQKIHARRAVHENGSWRLEETRRFDVDTENPTDSPATDWSITFPPTLVLALVAEPRDLTLGELTRFVARADIGSHPTYVYEIWRQRKFVQPATVAVILLLCVPLAQRFQRRDGAAVLVGVGVIGGFAFFAFDGLLVSMGETGILPPIMAAWSATAIFALIGLTMAFRREQL